MKDWKTAGQTRARHIITAVLLLAGLTVAAAAGRAQSNGLSLGSVSAGVKSNVIVPVMLDIESESVRVGRITATVGYDAKIVTFERAEKGFLLDGVGGTFKATTKENGDKSEVHLEVLTEGEPRKPFRKGLILSLIFRISETAAVDTKMPLPLSSVAALTIDATPQSIQPLALTSGMIEVLSPDAVPYVACFFFTH